MSTKKPSLKHAQTMYLYADSHAVIIYEKRHDKAGYIKWAEAFKTIGPKIGIESGRIILSGQSMMSLALKCTRIEAKKPDLKYGSIKTKEMGLACGTLSMRLPVDDFSSLYFYDIPGIMSGPYTYQSGESESHDELCSQYFWSGYALTVHDRSKATVEVAS